jgi:hypothetical protein
MYEAGEHGLIDRTKLFVELGSIVRSKGNPDTFGIVLSTFRGAGGWRAVVQWNNVRREEWISGLELICK